MPFTRDQTTELRQIIKEAVTAALRDDEVISHLVDKVTERINIQVLKDKINGQERRIKQLEEEVTRLENKLKSAEKFSNNSNVWCI